MEDDNKKIADCQIVCFDVYVIWCKITNRFYVGVTRQKNVYTRIRQHKRGKQLIDLEIQAIGWEGNFDWWIVEKHVPSTIITEREQKWVKFFDCVFPHGYNKTCGGIAYITVSEDTRAKISKAALERGLGGENNPMYGKTHSPEARAKISEARKVENLSEETRAKMSDAQKGKTLSAETRSKISEANMGEKNHFYGKHHTAETKEKISKANTGKPSPNKGKPLSPETKDKLRAKALERDMSGENNPFYGKHHTEESKEKNRQAHLGKPLSEETKAKLRGKHHSEETRAKMSESHKGKKLSPETCAKISAAKSGKNHHMYGKHHSEETKAKMRATRAAKKAAKENAAAQEITS